MEIKTQVNLKNDNTFGISVFASELIEILSIEDLKDALTYAKNSSKKYSF